MEEGIETGPEGKATAARHKLPAVSQSWKGETSPRGLGAGGWGIALA